MKQNLPDMDAMLRELNHRVKNNFQIIISLMNLKKRTMPPEHCEDLRFIEEHVQAMSVAYRLVYATGRAINVPLSELITDVLGSLREIARLDSDLLRISVVGAGEAVGLDQAIALALYLAVLLPPYLDRAASVSGTVTVASFLAGNALTLSVSGDWSEPVALDLLRTRLMAAYAVQLHVEALPAATQTERQFRFLLDAPPVLPEAS